MAGSNSTIAPRYAILRRLGLLRRTPARIDYESRVIQAMNHAFSDYAFSSTDLLLDLACGRGEFTGHLNRLGPARGIDLSEDQIRLARDSFPTVDFVVSEAVAFLRGLEDESISGIAAILVLELADDPESIMTEALRVLKPGHVIFTVLPNFRSLHYKVFCIIDALMGWFNRNLKLRHNQHLLADPTRWFLQFPNVSIQSQPVVPYPRVLFELLPSFIQRLVFAIGLHQRVVVGEPSYVCWTIRKRERA